MKRFVLLILNSNLICYWKETSESDVICNNPQYQTVTFYAIITNHNYNDIIQTQQSHKKKYDKHFLGHCHLNLISKH